VELTFGMALVIASRERLCFVDLAERPDHELMFINVEIVLHNIHIRHTRITFFYVRFETILFQPVHQRPSASQWLGAKIYKQRAKYIERRA